MSSDWQFDADVEWEKIQSVRTPWIALKDGSGPNSTWPKWVQKLDIELRAWLHGERVVYAEFGCDSDGSLWSGDAVEADGLWALIFTDRYVVRVRTSKKSKSRDAEKPELTVVPRSLIQSLTLDLVEDKVDLNGQPLLVRMSFEKLGEIQIPADAEDWFLVDSAVRLELFSGLRDDLYLNES